MKKAKNHFILLKKFKNTESAQLCWQALKVAEQLIREQILLKDEVCRLHSS